ncbi:hypothetical protein BCR44DRAFT_1436919 [Catenaria anguillulae PL171]|uniref:Uncharacterized protein n=1 Tax=Catenaria anguillulae PL171 TaxID=765915 RepID=A0A1Y2HJX3_9FUNG|nr:hypothetical protein BCR44DRAFT_1436919 [Catenaria anguillulae PL171]
MMTMMMQAAPNSSGLVNQVPARLLPTCGFPRHVSIFSSANQSNWRSPPRGFGRVTFFPLPLGLTTADRNLDISSGGAFV